MQGLIRFTPIEVIRTTQVPEEVYNEPHSDYHYRYPWEQMEVGNSFVIPENICLQYMRTLVWKHNKSFPDKQYCVRKPYQDRKSVV